MRIGHLLADAATFGGVRRVVDALSELPPHEHELLVASQGARLPRVRGSWPLPLPLLDRDLLERLRGLDLVVVHGVFAPSTARVARALVSRRGRPPVVAFPHDAYDAGLFSSRAQVKQAYFAVVERPRLVRSDGILVTAPSHEGHLRRRGVRTPVLVRPLGLTADEQATAERVRGGRGTRQESGVRLLFLGRWDVHEKGLDLLLPAVRQLADVVPGVRLRLVGPPYGQQEAVERLARATGAPVDLVGFVDDVWDEIARADLLVQPSRKEGFGLAALQALAAGLPVLLSTAAGLGELVGDADGARPVVPTAPDVAAGLLAAVRGLDELERAARAFAVTRAAGLTYEPVLDGLLALGAGRTG